MSYLDPTGFLQLLISLILYILLGPWTLCLVATNELLRLLVSLRLRSKYGGKISLVPKGSEAIWAFKRPNRPRVSTVFLKLDKLITCERVKQTFNDIVFQAKSSNGEQVYSKLKKIFVVKYGYACWEESEEEFDMEEHVRSLPDNKVYSKSEINKLIDEWSYDMSEERPQWEFIIVPRFVENAGDPETCLFITRLFHAYMDGLCFTMLYEKYLTTGYTWYINPFEFRIPFWKKFFWYMNAVAFGPYATLLLIITKTRKFWTEVPSNGSPPTTRYSWTKGMDADMIRKIRKKMNNPSLSTIMVNAYVAAAKEILPVGRLHDLLRVVELSAFLPYRNERPQNRFSGFYYLINSRQPDFERIKSTKKNYWKAISGPWIPITNLLIRSVGRFPVWFHFLVVSGGPNSLVMNSIPVSKTKVIVMESGTMLEVFTFSANPTDTGVQLLCASYANSVRITGMVRSEYLSESEFEDIFVRIPDIIDEWAQKLADDEVELV
ncbi:unnamed protein product [Orchesella dallaii]|uniref:O-acyltransferase WSD1 C-terminal domain-containing protein n=1 Tax=Orchesella dallaii TaxID=48710 RepID=A0ABP1QLY7_9HEXA